MSDLAGLFRGVVRDDTDSEYRGRLRVYVPQVYGQTIRTEDLPWAEPCFPYGGGRVQGAGFGLIAIPPVESSVWVAFEQGDPAHPVWLGCWYGARDAAREMPDEAVEGYPSTVVWKDPSSEHGMYIRFVRGEYIEIVSEKDEAYIRVQLGPPPSVTVMSKEGDVSLTSEEGTVQVLARDGRVHIENGKIARFPYGDLTRVFDLRQWIDLDQSPVQVNLAENKIDVPPKATIRVGDLEVVAQGDIKIRSTGSVSLSAPHASGFENH